MILWRQHNKEKPDKPLAGVVINFFRKEKGTNTQYRNGKGKWVIDIRRLKGPKNTFENITEKYWIAAVGQIWTNK